MLVVLVALFGVAGFALAAFGRLPAAGGAPPARTQGTTQPDASATGSGPAVAFPTGEAPADPAEPAVTGAPDTTSATGAPGAPDAHGAADSDHPSGRLDAEAHRDPRTHGDGDLDRDRDAHGRADRDTDAGSDPRTDT